MSTERETVISYVHNDDFLIFVGALDDCADLVIKTNGMSIYYIQFLFAIKDKTLFVLF